MRGRGYRKFEERVWRSAFASWPRAPRHPTPGYTLLLTVPPDLPVFLELAVAVCREQELHGLVETIVVPDAPSRPFRAVVERLGAEWPEGRLRLVEPGRLSAFLRRRAHTPSMIHALQLIAGASQVRSTHALMHDADLFLGDPAALDVLFERCTTPGVDVVGVDPPPASSAWLGPERFAHIVASRELMFSMEWLRARPPNEIRPKSGQFPEGDFWFETTLLAQALTPPEKVALQPAGSPSHSKTRHGSSINGPTGSFAAF